MTRTLHRELLDLVRSLMDPNGRLVPGATEILDEALPVFGVQKKLVREMVRREAKVRRALNRAPQRAPFFGASPPSGTIPAARFNKPDVVRG